MKKVFLFYLLFLCLAGMRLRAADQEIQAEGIGRSYRAAIDATLITALEQKCGITISATERSAIAESEKLVSVNGKDSSKIQSSDAVLKSSQKWIKGRINGYQVLSHTKEGGMHKVTLLVRVPGQYIVGRNPHRLRKMIVGVFQPKNYGCKFYGKQINARTWSEQFSNDLNVHLTQTRKFTMLDRAFSKEVNQELALLTGPNAAPSEMQKLNQKLGTDYLVLGYISFSDVVPGGENPLTGEAIPPASTIFATVHYRVILAPTGQLKWADTVKVDSSAFANSLFAGNYSDSANYAASCVCASLMANILPFQIVKVTADGTVVIGEGGKALIEGECLSVYKRGEKVTDTRTGEVIDRIETWAGIVQVTRVSSKLSYGRFVKGDPSKIPVGSILRRDSISARLNRTAAPAPSANPSQVRGTANGGVVVPF